MNSTVQRRLERIEMAEWRRNSEILDNYFEGRSIENGALSTDGGSDESAIEITSR
jgi:hypothetical protein